MEKVSLKSVGMVIGALLVMLLLFNAIPWATKAEVKEMREDLKAWYPALSNRVTKIEADTEHLKAGQEEIKALIREK